jgi:hypothetical protein
MNTVVTNKRLHVAGSWLSEQVRAAQVHLCLICALHTFPCSLQAEPVYSFSPHDVPKPTCITAALL